MEFGKPTHTHVCPGCGTAVKCQDKNISSKNLQCGKVAFRTHNCTGQLSKVA